MLAAVRQVFFRVFVAFISTLGLLYSGFNMNVSWAAPTPHNPGTPPGNPHRPHKPGAPGRGGPVAPQAKVPFRWVDAGLGTGVLYSVPRQFKRNDLPETHVNFPQSDGVGFYGFRSYLPAKACKQWNRVQFAIDYIEQPAPGDDIQGFAEKFTDVLFGSHGRSLVSTRASRKVIINGKSVPRVDLQAVAPGPTFCGARALHATFIKYTNQVVFIAFHDVGTPDAAPQSFIETVISTVRPFSAHVSRYQGPTWPAPASDETSTTSSGGTAKKSASEGQPEGSSGSAAGTSGDSTPPTKPVNRQKPGTRRGTPHSPSKPAGKQSCQAIDPLGTC